MGLQVNSNKMPGVSSRKSASKVYQGVRMCSRSGCRNIASQTLIYIYNESTAVLGPLATFAEPHTYDLCETHTLRLSVPMGWSIINNSDEFLAPGPSNEDLEAIAQAVREAGKKHQDEASDNNLNSNSLRNLELGRRGHLRSVSIN